MPLVNDIRKARRLAINAWRSRRNQRTLERIGAGLPPTPADAVLAVYFADSPVNLYQLRQWYAPLLDLSRTRPVVVMVRSAGTMLRLLDECPLPVVYLRTIGELEGYLASHRLKVMLYVNQNIKNFQMFRFGRLWHVFINHGESDKAYMTSSQHKAYDYVMVAGDAALDRLTSALWGFDTDRRALAIGRPQTDHLRGTPPYPRDDRVTVLYAPTWEGDRGSMSYGSVASHGQAIAKGLLADPRFRLIYRPHPRTGVSDHDYGVASREIVNAIAKANEADPSAHHLFDDDGVLSWQLATVDVAITDISAMIYDRLATGKPLLVTRPVSADAEVDESGYLSACEWLSAADAVDVISHVARVHDDSATRERLRYWVERYFGDTTPGASTKRFHRAVEYLIEEWDFQEAGVRPHEALVL